MHEAQIYKKLKKNKIKCELCNHQCLIDSGSVGICGVRYNDSGILYSLVYGKVAAKNIDPVEKKPLFHFMPGTKTYSIGTLGCNFRCVNCQNYTISQTPKMLHQQNIIEMPRHCINPQEIIDEALESNCPSISYTYNEPTVFFEFAFDCMKLARKNKLKNIWVSNGYMGDECLKKIVPYLDAINVDLKFFTDKNYLKICGAKLSPVLKNIKAFKKAGVWVELTTLLIQGLNDSKKELEGMAEFIVKELGIYTPWHISRFFPHYKLTEIMPTEKEKLIKAYNIGKKAGLKYVYIGNILDTQYSSTYCSKNHLIISRKGMDVQRAGDKKRCAKCGEEIIIIDD